MRWLIFTWLPSLGLAGPPDALLAPAPSALDSQGCGGTGCWTNHLRLEDLDGDGALDILFANYDGFFEEGAPQPLVHMRNDGSGGFVDVSTATLAGHEGRIRQVAVGDVDGDGSPDIVAPEGAGDPVTLFLNDGAGTFTDASERLPRTGHHIGAARLGDIDNDGDLDLVMADGYAQGRSATRIGVLWLNDGSGTFTDASDALPTTFDGVDPDDLDLVDVDRDFDLDVLVNMHEGNNNLWVNDGTGQFTDGRAQLADQRGGLHYNAAACDVDGDGDLDLWIDNVAQAYREQLLINDGSGTFVDRSADQVSNNPRADDNGVSCADVDHDGDFDAVVWSLDSVERVLVNDGTGQFSGVRGLIDTTTDPTLWGDLADLDGDGILDAVTGQGEGNPERNLVYLGTSAAMVDTRPPVIIAHEVPPEGTVPSDTVLRFAVSDATVSDAGPRLQGAFARIGANGRADARFSGGDVFRVVLPALAAGEGADVTLCAIDAAGNEGCTPPFRLGEPDGGNDPTDPTDPGDPSDPSDPSTPDDPAACGCATGGVGMGWLALLVWGVPRRRRLSTGP